MRYTGVQRMRGLLTVTDLDRFIQRQTLRRREIHGHICVTHLRMDQSTHRLKAQRAFTPDGVLDITGKTTGAIAAHLGITAVGIKEIPRPITVGFSLLEQHQPIRSDAALPMTNARNLFGA